LDHSLPGHDPEFRIRPECQGKIPVPVCRDEVKENDMDGFLPFRPNGPGFVLAATNAGGAATKIGPAGGDVDFLIVNPTGGQNVWIGYGMTSDVAVANAVVPLIGASTNAIPSPVGSIQTFTLVGGMFFSPKTELGSCSISITPGFGG
jgi:hypothetical protein